MRNAIISKALSSLQDNMDVVKTALDEHIHDDSMHYLVETKIENNNENTFNFYNGDSESSIVIGFNKTASSSEIHFLSIGWDSATIQNEIDSAPHNLNGHTIIFLFVVPSDFADDNGKYILNLGDDPIAFTNFRNGRVIVAGDFLHENSYGFTTERKNPGTEKNYSATKMVARFENLFDSPETIEKLSFYEEETDDNLKYTTANNLNKIIIQGTGLNEYYSSVVFAANKCETILLNLTIESSISSTSNTINLSDFYRKIPPVCRKSGFILGFR